VNAWRHTCVDSGISRLEPSVRDAAPVLNGIALVPGGEEVELVAVGRYTRLSWAGVRQCNTRPDAVVISICEVDMPLSLAILCISKGVSTQVA
jgi:hypothetical protein